MLTGKGDGPTLLKLLQVRACMVYPRVAVCRLHTIVQVGFWGGAETNASGQGEFTNTASAEAAAGASVCG